MGAFFTALRLLISLLPAPFQLFILAVLGICLFVTIFKVVAFVLDSIPFL